MMDVTRCKHMSDVPRAVETWEQEWAYYQQRTGENLPETLRVNILLKMVPSDFEDEVRLRYVRDEVDYSTLRHQVFDFAARRGPPHRQVHAVEREDPKAPQEDPGDEMLFVLDEEIDSLGFPTKGKGGGKFL